MIPLLIIQNQISHQRQYSEFTTVKAVNCFVSYLRTHLIPFKHTLLIVQSKYIIFLCFIFLFWFLFWHLFCHNLEAYWLFPTFTPFSPCLAPVCWRLSAPGLCNAHCPASQDISQCSQAEVAQRVPERKPKIGLPIYLSAAIDSFTSSAWTYESTRIHPHNKMRRKERQILSLSHCIMSLFRWSSDMKVDHMVGKTWTVVSDLLWYYLCATQWGACAFQEENGKNKKPISSQLYLYLSLYKEKRKKNSQFFTSKFRIILSFCMYPSGGELDLTLCSLH